MPRYALIKSGNMVELRDMPAQPVDIPHKSVVWLPCPPVVPPLFDPIAEVIDGPSYTIGPSAVTEGWAKRSKTAQEIDADKDSALNAVNGMYAPLLKILRNHENRLRLLENQVFTTSKSALSLADVRAAIRAIL